jgi:hypothetical protein
MIKNSEVSLSFILILSTCHGIDDYCSDVDSDTSHARSFLQTSSRLPQTLIDDYRSSFAAEQQEKTCPEECKEPNCFVGSKWNGGLALGKDSGSCEFYCSAKTEGAVDQGMYRYCGHGPNYEQEGAVDCTACGKSNGTQPYSLHDIVGDDGVLVLTMNASTERFNSAWYALNMVHIKPTRFVAMDFRDTSWQELENGCRAPSEASKEICKQEGKAGSEGGGCVNQAEQAIALSHKKALEHAMERDHEWTAVFEDDVVPLSMDAETWGSGLRKAWATRPPAAKIVRLGWCQATPETVKVTPVAGHKDSEPFMAYHAPSGGCTHAYLVHKDVIPQLLGLFPCCCAIDCCWELDYFDKQDSSGKMRSESVLINIDVADSGKKNLELLGEKGWFGIATQNRKQLPSTDPHKRGS